MPINYTPLEEEQLAYMQQFAGSHPRVAEQIAPMFFGTIEGAQERMAQNRATRQEGLSQLRQLAMELASSTASEDAVSAAILGQAGSLPGMGPRRMEGLEGFVSGLYDEGPVSGLAPMDVRSQYAGTLDQEDRGVVGQIVVQGLEAGTPFREIRETVRKTMVGAGYDEFSMSEALNEAESAYERLIGTSLEELRGFGGELRESISATGGDEQDLTFPMLSEATGLDQDLFAQGGRYFQGPNISSVEQYLGELANDPNQLRQLMQQDLVMPRPDDGEYEWYNPMGWANAIFGSGGLPTYRP